MAAGRVESGKAASKRHFVVGEDAHVLIDSLTQVLEKSGCLDRFWGGLDAGDDATLAVASSRKYRSSFEIFFSA